MEMVQEIGQGSRAGSLRSMAWRLFEARDSAWAQHAFKSAVEDVVRASGAKHVLEVGGGRSPLFSREEIDALQVRYACNDISEAELARAPAYVDKVCFDIAGEVSLVDAYDLIFSTMVFEHVSSGARAYRNVFQLLKPGGVAINFHPVLFSPPFVANLLLPEAVSRKVLRAFFPPQRVDSAPKFPARYSWCYAHRRMERKLKGVGFSDALIVPFYGHV